MLLFIPDKTFETKIPLIDLLPGKVLQSPFTQSKVDLSLVVTPPPVSLFWNRYSQIHSYNYQGLPSETTKAMHIVITKPRWLRRAAQISKYSDTSATSAPAHCPAKINLQTWTGQRHNKIFRIAAHFLSTPGANKHVKSIGTSQSSQLEQSWKIETRKHCFF